MYLRGVSDVSCNHEESVAWAWLLFHKQGNASFRKIMKSFPSTAEQRKTLTRTIRQSLGSTTTTTTTSAVPMQIVWAQGEVAIPKYQCDYIRDNLNVGQVHEVPGRHFFQLESAPLIVDKILEFLESS